MIQHFWLRAHCSELVNKILLTLCGRPHIPCPHGPKPLQICLIISLWHKPQGDGNSLTGPGTPQAPVLTHSQTSTTANIRHNSVQHVHRCTWSFRSSQVPLHIVWFPPLTLSIGYMKLWYQARFCQQSKAQQHNSYSTIHIRNPRCSIWQHPHDISSNSHTYFLACIEPLTSWPEAIPITDITAETAQVL